MLYFVLEETRQDAVIYNRNIITDNSWKFVMDNEQ